MNRRLSRSGPVEALPKKCIKCTFMKPPKVLQCPCCGFIPTPQTRAKHLDGELIEMQSRSVRTGPSMAEQKIFYAELKRIQETRGYRGGWTAHKFKDKFGRFPPFDFNAFPSCSPSAATLRWVQSRNIAFAKARHRGAA
jgi:DNA repair protein RadD